MVAAKAIASVLWKGNDEIGNIMKELLDNDRNVTIDNWVRCTIDWIHVHLYQNWNSAIEDLYALSPASTIVIMAWRIQPLRSYEVLQNLEQSNSWLLNNVILTTADPIIEREEDKFTIWIRASSKSLKGIWEAIYELFSK